ncbi:UNKNOWN [Stylonychia lemnae]|uniref:Uncharacterized protein n=1 Tax=Stylonychia lemnae TaxID=5949 RepID=A0A078A0Q5_STYLE|nr:UNKNOWN [Stylonychia lemnae]|eukprot:CDW75437.1 UNKNOWN [Stylonychia lemnae]
MSSPNRGSNNINVIDTPATILPAIKINLELNHNNNSLSPQRQQEQKGNQNNQLNGLNLKLVNSHKRHGSHDFHNTVNATHHKPKYDRSHQYSHRQMEEILRPIKNNMTQLEKYNDNLELYQTETKKQYQSFDKEQDRHYQDLRNKQEVTLTRRMMETYNAQSIKKAVGQQILSNRNQLRDKMEKQFLSKNNAYNDNDESFEYEWTPCRFNPSGWRYQPKGSHNQFLNHPNKKNVVGYMPSEHNQSTNTSEVQSLKLRSENNSILPPQSISMDLQSTLMKQSGMQKPIVPNQYTTSYQQNYHNKTDIGKSMNSINASRILRSMEQQKEYEDAPLPNIQAAKLAFLKNLKDQQQKVVTSDTIANDIYSQANSALYGYDNSIKSLSVNSSPIRGLKLSKNSSISKIVHSTLDGILSGNINEEDQGEDQEDTRIWAGIKVPSHLLENMGKRKDRVTKWENQYYNGGLFKHIK